MIKQTIRSQISAVSALCALSLAITFSDCQSAYAIPIAESEIASSSSLTRMPVKEITVFKDGHALLVHEGEMPLTTSGDVILEDLPKPVLGTFFPYSLETRARLNSVTAGRRKIQNSQTALTIPELIAANVGALVHIDELIGHDTQSKLLSYDAKIIGIPTRSAEELAAASGETSAALTLPVKSNLVELETADGHSFVAIDHIQKLAFKSTPRAKVSDENLRNVLTMALDWEKSARNNTQERSARVGMMYVERGIRWIPNYKVTIDGQGRARVKLQATLVNDLTDLKDVNCNLVVGVPSFAFKGETDPISLSEALARVASYAGNESRMRNNLSNSIMTQSQGYAADDSRVGAAEPGERETTKNEDLFVFSVKHLTLKKGERMVVPVEEYTVEYKDLYTLELAVLPPPEVQSQRSGSQMDEQNKLVDLNKVMHKIRLFNTTKHPFTTAPALVVVANPRDNDPGNTEVLAQGMMTYASPGSNSELTLTNAVDIKTKKEEKETGRTPDAVNWQDNKYARVDLSGVITLTNYMDKPITIEIKRKVLGRLDTISDGGKMKMVNTMDELKERELPPWWGYYSWPGWWSYMNGIGEFSWTKTIQPGQSADANYTWHYFWR